MKLPTSKEMQALDRSAIEDFEIPGMVLMENAGLGTVLMMEKKLGPCRNTFCCIFVGPGNNGGDGLVIGRHLHQRGCQPVFFLLVSPDRMKGDAAANMRIVEQLRLPYHLVDTESRVQAVSALYKQMESRGLPCYAVVDALFGIGLDRPVEDRFKTVIDLINNPDFAGKVPVVSVDCPSGMDADTGRILGSCVQADYTATYGCAKPGHFLHEGYELTGELEIIDIGIPPEAVDERQISTELISADSIHRLSGALRRKTSSHKGSHGHLLVLGGSEGKTGAAILAAKGGLRGGCGLVTLCAPQSCNHVFENALLEAMTVALPNSTTHFESADLEPVIEALEGKTAVVLGPGLGTAAATVDLVLALYRDVRQPIVVDADALNILARNKSSIGDTAGVRIFTPHPGELSRLLDSSVQDIQANRLEAAREACAALNSDRSHNIVVLKGAGTIVAEPGGVSLINVSGNPGMATGGMGDVLTGIIGALLCQGIEPLAAAAAAVYLHGLAADSLYAEMGAGYTAGEVADRFPSTLKSLLN